MKEIKLKGLDEVIYEHTSSCGLKTYIWQNSRVNGVYATLSVNYGSLHTDFKIKNKEYHLPTGIAHFLEHVKFNIDKDTTAHDLFYKIGGDSNAFTTFKYTSYLFYATENIQANLNLLLDYVYNPYFTKENISKEKGIIVEEAQMGNDNPDSLTFWDFYNLFFTKLNYKNKVVGSISDIKKISVDDIKLVYDTFYHPKNMFLIVTGNVNPYEIAKIVDDNLSNKNFKEYSNPSIIHLKESEKVNKEFLEKELDLTTSKVRYGLKIAKKKFKNFTSLELRLYASLLLNNNFGESSDFKEELLIKNLIHNMFAYYEDYDDFIGLIIYAETDYPEEIVKIIKEKMSDLTIDKKDFDRKIKASIASMILQFESVQTVNNKIQQNIINYGKIIDDNKIIVQNLNMDKMRNFIKLSKKGSSATYIARAKKNSVN